MVTTYDPGEKNATGPTRARLWRYHVAGRAFRYFLALGGPRVGG